VPERPLLSLPQPVEFAPKKGNAAIPGVTKPSPQRQQGRLGPRFDRLMQVAGSPEDLMALRDDPASIAPERAIVFEVAGSLPDFYAQARALGLEYLGDFEDDIEPSEDFHDGKKPEKTITGRIYLAMPDVRALQELLSAWRRYTAGEKMEYSKGAWTTLFSLLVDVRPWGPQDRVPAETIAFWQSMLAQHPEAPVRFEVELWFYENADRRDAAFARLEAEVNRLGGAVVHHAVIPEIRYDAALVDIPPDQVQAIIDHPDIALARVDEIMFLRPQSAAIQPEKDALEGADGPAADGAALPQGDPVAALLDGLPIQNHARLAGRLVIDDPDDLEPQYPVDSRAHGTEMASLIVHGDLNRGEAPIPRPLFVMPVMQPDGNGRERTPDDKLLVDVIYRAVRRIKEGDGDQPASAPGVIVINLSICDSFRPFARVMSPLGRLLDHLAHRYRVLFLISAGNITDRIAVPPFQTSIEFEGATAEEREQAILDALNANKSQRTLFSPAEALNGLTIGAAHAGSAFNGGLPTNLIDPFTDGELPNIASAMGLGFRRAVKPELLLEGGRAPVRVVASGGGILIEPVRAGARMFGAKAAAPNRIGGTRHEDFTWGTSVATALATRGAHLIHDVLADANGGSNHADIPPDYMALIVKALLVHGASWGPKGEFLDGYFTPQGQGSHFERRDDIARLLGYGVPKIERVLDCTESRATLLGVGDVAPGSALLYRIPIPAALDGVREFRALTVTLAWFSPVNPRHQGYRMAALDVSPGSEEKYWITLNRESLQPTDKATGRGTVFHERRSGEKAAVFVDGGDLLLRVTARASAGDLTDPVPFALAVSFEVGVESGIQVYDEIRARLAARVAVGAGA
jgi:hypothetical protein